MSDCYKVGDCFIDEHRQLFLIIDVEEYPLDRYVGFIVHPEFSKHRYKYSGELLDCFEKIDLSEEERAFFLLKIESII